MPTPQSTARKMSAASAPSRDPYHAGAADRHVPRPVHYPTSSRQNNGSVSHPASTYPTASPRLDKREASAGTSTLLPQTPSRRSSVRRGSNSKEDIKRGKTSKPGFFASLFHKLVSCVGLSTRAHDIDTDGVPSVVSRSSLREKEARESSEKPPAPAGITVTRATGPPAPLPEKGRPVAPPKDVLPIQNDPTSGAVQPPGSSFPNQSEDGDDSGDDAHVPPEALFDDEDMILLRNGGAGIPIGSDGRPRPLLPPIAPKHAGRKCLVLDLDETLVHSNFRAIPDPDFIVPVEIDNHWHNMYVQKRPGVDDFLRQMGEMYEVVVYTASLSAYADPVMDHLDMYNVVSHRLFRESCYRFKGNFVKDLSQLGRRMEDTIIIDNSPASYIFHPANAVPISSWFNDPHDTELIDLCPFLTDLADTRDVRSALNPGL